jgi:TolA-binding protein
MNSCFFATIAALGFLVTECMSLAAQADLAQQEGGQSQAHNGTTQIITGRVAVEGGSAQVADATVVLECDGAVRQRTNTSVDGNFTLSGSAVQTSFDASSGSARFPAKPSPIPSTVVFCSLYAEAPGYTSEPLFLSVDQSSEITDAGTIMLRSPKGKKSVENATVSVGTLAAPSDAKKVFEKGMEQAKKKKWQSACEYFRRAIEIYPRYAVAWLELGRAQLEQKALPDAQHSFQRAIAEDDHFIAAYLDLTDVAAKQKDWALVAGTTDHLAQLAPDLSPKTWFFNSVAKFNLGNIVGAEQSVIRGLKLDARHKVPQLEYVYGVVLARQGKYDQAIEHIRSYLQRSPHGEAIPEAQSTLSTLERLTSHTP